MQRRHPGGILYDPLPDLADFPSKVPPESVRCAPADSATPAFAFACLRAPEGCRRHAQPLWGLRTKEHPLKRKMGTSDFVLAVCTVLHTYCNIQLSSRMSDLCVTICGISASSAMLSHQEEWISKSNPGSHDCFPCLYVSAAGAHWPHFSNKTGLTTCIPECSQY